MFENFKQIINQEDRKNNGNEEENYKEFNHIKNKLFNEVEIIKQTLFSTVNTSYVFRTITGSKTYTIQKWFKKGKGRFSFLRNNNFLQFNHFLSSEEQENIAILLDQFRDFTAHGSAANWFVNTSKYCIYNIDVEHLVIFLFIITKNRSTVKRIVKLINEFYQCKKFESDKKTKINLAVEEINVYVSKVVEQNFSSKESELNTVKRLQNLNLFNKDLKGTKIVNEKCKRIKIITSILYKKVLEINDFNKSTEYFKQILGFEIIMNERLKRPAKPYIWMIEWLKKYFAAIDEENENVDFSKESIIINSDLNMKITISPENKSEYFKISFISTEKQSTNLLLLVERKPLDILYLIFWLKCVGVERFKFFLENNHQNLDVKKIKKFSRWENITEISNKIKDLFNSAKGFNACGFKIESKKMNEKYSINDAISLVSSRSITTLLWSKDFKTEFTKEGNYSIYVAELRSLNEMMFKSIQNFNNFNHSVLGSDKLESIKDESNYKSIITDFNPYPNIYKSIRNNSSHYSFIGDFYWDESDSALNKKSINDDFKQLVAKTIIVKDKDFVSKISAGIFDKIKVVEKIKDGLNKRENKTITQINKNIKNDKMHDLILKDGYEYFKVICLFLYHVYKYSSKLLSNNDAVLIKHLNNVSGKTKIWDQDSYNQFFARRANNLFLQQFNLFNDYFSISRTKLCDEAILKGKAAYEGLDLYSDFRLKLIYRCKNEESTIIENKADENKVLKYIYETFFYTSTDKTSIKILFKIFFKLFLKLMVIEEKK